MKKSITKTIGLVLLAFLMMFSTIFFTACSNSDLEKKLADLEKQVQDLENENEDLQDQLDNQNQQNQNQNAQNQIALLNAKAQNLISILCSYSGNSSAVPSQTVSLASTAMTAYNGIKSWQLNSVDFTNSTESLSYFGPGSIELMLLQGEHINVNEDYQKSTYTNAGGSTYDRGEYLSKVSMSDTEMVIYNVRKYFKNDVQVDYSVARTFVKFQGNTIKNVVVERLSNALTTNRIDVTYFANNSRYVISYEASDSTALATGLKTSLVSELTKSVKSGSISLDN